MEVTRTITVQLTPDEVGEIIKEHLLKENIEVDYVYFNIENVYHDHYDQHGSPELTVVECKGTLNKDNNE